MLGAGGGVILSELVSTKRSILDLITTLPTRAALPVLIISFEML